MEEAVKERENLYKLIISQLRYDGCEAIAASLAKTTNIISPCPPSARLHQVVNLGLRAEAEGARPENSQLPGLTTNTKVLKKGIDLEYEPDDYHCHHHNGQAHQTQHNENHKPASNSDSGGESDRENVPPKEVQEHILRITKNKIAAEEIKVVRSNGEVSLSNEELSADNVCLRVKQELQKMNISQEVFAKCVLGKTQGYLSEMLKHGEKVFYSREKANSKGRMNFEKMRQFLLKPEEERRVIYADKARQLREERMMRKRMSFTMAYSPQAGYDVKPSKMRCHSPSPCESETQVPTQATASPSLPPRHVVSPYHPSDAHRSPIIVKTEPVTSPTETTGYKNLPHPRNLCDRLVFLREDAPIRQAPEMASYISPKREPEEFEVDKTLVTTKIAALSRKQLTPVKTRPAREEKDPETSRYYTAAEARRHSDSDDSSYGIPEDVVTIETLPLQSLAAADMEGSDERPEPLVIRREPSDRRKEEPRRYRYERHIEYDSDTGRPEPFVFRRESFDPSKVEIGENVYVVQVDGTDAIRVTSSM